MIYDESIIKEDIKKLEAREFYIKYIIKTNYWYFAEYQHTEGTQASKMMLEKCDVKFIEYPKEKRRVLTLNLK